MSFSEKHVLLRSGFQLRIRNEIPLTAMVSVHFAQKATDGQKPPLLLETRTKERLGAQKSSPSQGLMGRARQKNCGA